MTAKPTDSRHLHAVSGRFSIEFPDTARDLSQDEEWFILREGERSRKLRIHDYAELYKVPGLYEKLVYDRLRCDSPRRLAAVLDEALRDWDQGPEDLRVLDLGAGNGVVAEHLQSLGVPYRVGVDLLPEAAEAAKRDRPAAYKDYLVADLTRLKPEEHDQLRRHQLNCLVTVAALGFGDIPVDAFATAFNAIACPGWLAFTIKDDFLEDRQNPFARLVTTMIDQRVIQVQAFLRYRHRVSVNGQKLHYLALVARKHRALSESLLDEVVSGAPADEASALATRLVS